MDVNDLISRTVDVGHSIVVIKGNERQVHSKVYLTKCWLTMSNDDFFEQFGFSWVPPAHLQNVVRNAR